MAFEQIGFEFQGNDRDVLSFGDAMGLLSAALITAKEAQEAFGFINNRLLGSIVTKLGIWAEFSDVILTVASSVSAARDAILNLQGAINTLFASGVNASNLKKLLMLKDVMGFNAQAAEAFAREAIAANSVLQDQQAFVGTLFLGAEDAAEMVDGLGESVNKLVSGPLQDMMSQGEATAGAYDWLSAFPEYTENAEALAEGMMGLEAGLKLAAATGTQSRVALEGLAQVMQSYDVAADDAAETAAKLNAIVQQGITEYPRFAGRIGRLAGAADSAGISFDEMAGSFALLSRTLGTDTGLTSLENLYLQMIELSPQAKDELARLGVVVDETTLKQRGLVDVLNEAYRALGSNSEGLARLIPEQRAFAAALRLVEDGGEAAREAIENIAETDTDSLQELFDQRNQTNIKRWNALVNQAGRIIEEFGQELEPVVAIGIGALEQITDAIDNLPDWLNKTVASMVMLLTVGKQTANALGILFNMVARVARIMLAFRASILLMDGTLAKLASGTVDFAYVIRRLTGELNGSKATLEAYQAAMKAAGATQLTFKQQAAAAFKSAVDGAERFRKGLVGLGQKLVKGELLSFNLGKAIQNAVGNAAKKSVSGFFTTVKEALKVTGTALKSQAKAWLSYGKTAIKIGTQMALVYAAIRAAIAGIAVWNADYVKELRQGMEEVRESIGLVEEEGPKAETAIGKMGQALGKLTSQPILAIQQAYEVWTEDVMATMPIIGGMFGDFVTNAERAARQIALLVSDESTSIAAIAIQARSVADELAAGTLDIDDEEAQSAMQGVTDYLAQLRAAQDQLKGLDISDEEFNTLNAQLEQQIGLLEGARRGLKRFGVEAEEQEEPFAKLNLALREMGDALEFIGQTGLTIDRLEEMNRTLELTPGLLNTGIKLFYGLQQAGESAEAAMSEVARVLELNGEQTEALTQFIRDSEYARRQRIRDEINLTRAIEDNIEAQQDQIDVSEDHTQAIQQNARALQHQTELQKIAHQARVQSLERENQLLSVQMRDVNAVLEDENATRTERAEAEREMAALAEERKQNEIDRAVAAQELAEQTFLAEQRQMDVQMQLEQIDLRREATKIRIAELENKAAIATDKAALAEAERTGNIEEAEMLRRQISDRQKLGREYKQGYADLAQTAAFMQTADQQRRQVAAQEFAVGEQGRANALLNTLLGYGDIGATGGAGRESRRDRMTEAERALQGIFYQNVGMRDVRRRDTDEQAVQAFLSNLLGQGLTSQTAQAPPLPTVLPAAAPGLAGPATSQPALPATAEAGGTVIQNMSFHIDGAQDPNAVADLVLARFNESRVRANSL